MIKMAAIDGGSRSDKPVNLIYPAVENPRAELVRVKRTTRKTGKLSKFKDGRQKFVYSLKHPEDWHIITDKTLIEIAEMGMFESARIEPFFGSYHKDREVIISAFRSAGIQLLEPDISLTARARIAHEPKIPKDETTDTTDALLIYMAGDEYFGPTKKADEKIIMDRSAAKQDLEAAEEANWSDDLSNFAMKIVDTKQLSEKYGEDLTTPVFIVSAVRAALDPAVNNRRDFDRFCGLAARFRRGKKGVGSIISSNLSHFNKNPKNKTAARYVFHKVKEYQRNENFGA